MLVKTTMKVSIHPQRSAKMFYKSVYNKKKNELLSHKNDMEVLKVRIVIRFWGGGWTECNGL